ncbi:MAG: HPr family phosphocarrier protein [Candidatus Ratteibacteria bacterium]
MKIARKSSRALEEIMTKKEIEKVFIPKLREITSNFFAITEYFIKHSNTCSKEFFVTFTKESDRIESFLDDYGATHNKTFFYFRELIAAIRWFTQAIFQNLHIISRYDSYMLNLPIAKEKQFLSGLRNNLSFLLETLTIFGKEIISEGKHLRIIVEKDKIYSHSVNFDLPYRKMLPSDIEQQDVGDRDRLIGFLLKFLNLEQDLEMFSNTKEMQTIITEESLENFRSGYHRLQSMYDTYIGNTDLARNLIILNSLRGHISVNLHLLEMARSLIHFYERHTERLTKIAEDRAGLRKIRFNDIKECVKSFILPFVFYFAKSGKALAEEIFKILGTDPDEYVLESMAFVISPYRIEDFHLRPVMPVTQIAARYSANIDLYFNRKRYDLKSPLEMAMAIPDIREKLATESVRIIVRGPRKATREIFEFFKQCCGAIQEQQLIQK